jgi:hypothetical protein
MFNLTVNIIELIIQNNFTVLNGVMIIAGLRPLSGTM